MPFKVLIASTNQADHDLVEKRFTEARHKVFHIFSNEELNTWSAPCPMHLVIVGNGMVANKPITSIINTRSVLVLGVAECERVDDAEIRIAHRLTDKVIDYLLKPITVS